MTWLRVLLSSVRFSELVSGHAARVQTREIIYFPIPLLFAFLRLPHDALGFFLLEIKASETRPPLAPIHSV